MPRVHVQAHRPLRVLAGVRAAMRRSEIQGNDMKREGIVYGLPEREYHAPKDELSSTGAKLILESPAKFKYQIIDGNRVWRAGFDLGTAVHTKVLGVGEKFIEYPGEHLTPSGNVSTKAATVVWEAAQRAEGKIILTPDQSKQVDAMAEAVLAHPLAVKLFEREGRAEVSVFDEFLGVKRRGRFDFLPDEGRTAVDLKTTMDASAGGFARSVASYGYHIQRAHYTHILRQLGRDVEMLFVTVEKTAPYLVNVHQLNDQFKEMGEAEALEAVDIYRRCAESGEWPGYPLEINNLVPPMWSIYDYQDRYENEEMQI